MAATIAETYVVRVQIGKILQLVLNPKGNIQYSISISPIAFLLSSHWAHPSPPPFTSVRTNVFTIFAIYLAGTHREQKKDIEKGSYS
jgi:hypothetical protein